MNEFERRIIEQHETIDIDDFNYFTEEAEKKIADMGLPKSTCEISQVFVDCKTLGNYYRREYCLKNCGLKCI